MGKQGRGDAQVPPFRVLESRTEVCRLTGLEEDDMARVRIVEMDHIVLAVRDIEGSLEFYTGTLGLQGERLEEYRAGKVGFPSVRINEHTLIDLVQVATPDGTVARNLDHFCLVSESTDLGELAADLRSRGVVVVRDPVSRWGARGQATSIYIQDPDGNEIEIRCY
jgi:catechol 2,3-dioxygenase-like lactoylglutathione lyase family enzyme